MNTTHTAPALPSCFTPQLGRYEITRDGRCVIVAEVTAIMLASEHPDVVMPKGKAGAAVANWLHITYVPEGCTTPRMWTVAPEHLRFLGPVAS